MPYESKRNQSLCTSSKQSEVSTSYYGYTMCLCHMLVADTFYPFFILFLSESSSTSGDDSDSSSSDD